MRVRLTSILAVIALVAPLVRGECCQVTETKGVVQCLPLTCTEGGYIDYYCDNPRVTSIDLSNLVNASGVIISNCTGEIKMTNLKEVFAYIAISNSNFTKIDLPAFENGGLTLQELPHLTTISAPVLQSLGGKHFYSGLIFQNIGMVKSLSLPKLEYTRVSALEITHNSYLEYLSMPKLHTVDFGYLQVAHNPKLVNVSFASLESVHLSTAFYDNPKLSRVLLGSLRKVGSYATGHLYLNITGTASDSCVTLTCLDEVEHFDVDCKGKPVLTAPMCAKKDNWACSCK